MTTRAPALRCAPDEPPARERPALAPRAATPLEAPSFEVVYERHFDYLWRTLRALGVAEAHIDDAVQDAFVVVHRRLGEFEGRARLETWLFAIARRVAQGYRRSAGRQRERVAPLEDELPDPAAADPAAAAERAQAGRVLVELLGQLDDDKRDIFVLVEIEQVPVPAAAEALGLKLNTAYSRLRLARQRFEAALAVRIKEGS